MAIIYTYPKLTNPQGNELIVVTDVNNKNSTRLITVADIAGLIPSGPGGCTEAIKGITDATGLGILYEAVACSYPKFQSTDNSILITSTGINDGLDFVVADAGCDNVFSTVTADGGGDPIVADGWSRGYCQFYFFNIPEYVARGSYLCALHAYPDSH